MNDERMISQTSTVHKLDEVSSWSLADSSKYVRERVGEEESVKKSECGLSCWLVLSAARKRRERMYALSCCWLVLLLACGEARRGKQDRSVLLERPAWKRVKEYYLAFL